MDTSSVAIVGAGIAGLTAAHRLKSAGIRPVIFESQNHVGGRMHSVKQGDFLFDLGTIVLTGGYAMLPELVKTAGLEGNFNRADDLIVAIVRDGKAKRIDSAHPIRDFLKTDLLSLVAKIRLLKLAAKVIRHHKLFDNKNSLGFTPFDGETVSQYAQRALGRESSDYLCSALMRGLWCTDAASDSSLRLFWALKQFIYPLSTLSCGNGALTEVLARQFDVRTQHKISAVSRSDHGVELTVSNNKGTTNQSFAACVVAVPPPIALNIVPEISGIRREFFETATFTSLICVHLGLSEKPENPETVLMFPEKESQDIAAVYFNHNKAPGRAPEGKGSISIYFSERWSMTNWKMPDEELLTLAVERAHPHIENLNKVVEESLIHRWPFFGMQGSPGVYSVMEQYQRSLKGESSPIQYAGDFLPNPGVNQAMGSGETAAEKIIQFLSE